LQVENEETFEALSARSEALLESIQQRFSFLSPLFLLDLALVARFTRPFLRRVQFGIASLVNMRALHELLRRYVLAPRLADPIRRTTKQSVPLWRSNAQ
jgi:hypothetical protein